MRDESTKQAAQEYLAAKLTEEEQIYEEKHNMALAVARATTRHEILRIDPHVMTTIPKTTTTAARRLRCI